MPNPRYVSKEGKPTPELLEKLRRAKQIMLGNIPAFCDKWGVPRDSLENIVGVFLIGSHATDGNWLNETSDLDLKLITPDADSEILRRFRTEVLRPILTPVTEEKRYWIDVYFVQEDYQVTPPRVDLTEYWRSLSTLD